MAVSVVDTTIDVESLMNKPSAELSPSLVPNWLNNEFLLKHLQNHFNDRQLHVQNFQVKPATAKGENYASVIYRVTVKFVDGQQNVHSLNIIVKAALSGDFAFESLSEFNVYDKEIDFYQRIAPQLNKLLQKLNANDQLLAATYGVCGTNKAILIEDLTLKGYRLLPIQSGCDLTATKMVLKKSAAFHACSAVLQQQHINIFENFRHGLVSRATDKLDRFYLTQFDAMVETLSNWPNFATYTEKLRGLRGEVMERGRKAFDADPKHFNSLIHGDMWVNNMMMKYDVTEQSILENMVYLDFQFSCWTSPTIDLHYFLNTSLQEPLRWQRDELIEFYHKHLVEFLQQLNYRNHIPSLMEFRQQFLEKSFYGFMAACLIQPLMVNEHTENADFDALVLGDERSIQYKRLMYSSPKTQERLKRLVPYYDELGVFDEDFDPNSVDRIYKQKIIFLEMKYSYL